MRNLWHALLHFFFRLLYNELAWSYDIVAWLVSRGHWKAWGRTTLSHLRGERVLELGHGPGHLLVTLLERDLVPVGLDLSPHMGRQAKRRLRRSGVAVPLVRARAKTLPFRSGSFDSVVATFPTDFILHPHTQREVARILSSPGRLVVAVGVRFEGKGLTSRVLRWLYRVTGQNEPSPDAFRTALQQAGLAVHVVWKEVKHAAVMLVVAEKAL
jgi:ubiquinone/menaquinone biosynthesis C-methylase UbiE